MLPYVSRSMSPLPRAVKSFPALVFPFAEAQITTTNLHQDRSKRLLDFRQAGCGILSVDSTDQLEMSTERMPRVFNGSIRIAFLSLLTEEGIDRLLKLFLCHGPV